MDVDDESIPDNSSLRAPQFACDSCRSRKVKCDEQDPCGPCTSGQRECRRSHVSRPREKRQRVLVSSQYERKIDRIEAQIEGVTRLLATLQAQIGNHQTVKSEGPVFTPAVTPAQAHIAEQGFEGETSLAAHSRFVNHFVESALRQNASPGNAESLMALKQLTADQRTSPAEAEEITPDQPSTGAQYDLPPFTAVAALLKSDREGAGDTLGEFITTIVTSSILSQHCMDVYFTQTYTDAQLIVVAGTLFWLFADRAARTLDAPERQILQKHEKLCLMAFESALARLPLHMPKTKLSVLALVTGAVHAIGTARPAFAWTMTSRASELSQSLGLHRASSSSSPDQTVPETKVPLFWLLYILDKGLALRLGRAPSIQDYDVDLPRGMHGPYMNSTAARHARYIDLWITLARTQGNIYRDLFSPYALGLPRHIREANAIAFADELAKLRKELTDIYDAALSGPKTDARYTVLVKADEVAISCLLTLVYRALSPDEGSTSIFNSKCMRAARETLSAHQFCMRLIEPEDVFMLEMYINWSLLHTPFIPFIVIFCNIIETSDATDLTILEDFLTSLHTARTISEPMDKAYRLFNTLCTIAGQVTAGKGDRTLQAVSMGDSMTDLPAMARTADEDVILAAFARPQRRNSAVAEMSVFTDWSAEQQQMFDSLQDEALQLFGTNFVTDLGTWA